MKVTLSREAAYAVRDRLNEVLAVDEEAMLILHSVEIATPGNAEDYPYEKANVDMNFCSVEADGNS